MHRIAGLAAVLLTAALLTGCAVRSGGTNLDRARIGLDPLD